MMVLQFSTLCIFLLISIVHESENSLLSRFKNTNEYVAREQDYGDLLPDEMDKDTYQDLLREVPELRMLGNRSSSRQYITYPAPWHPFDNRTKPFNTSTIGPLRMPFITRWPSHNMSGDGRRFLNFLIPGIIGAGKEMQYFFDPWSAGKYLTSCAYCGFKTERIPRSALCYNAFQSEDWRHRTLARYFRIACYKNDRINGFRTIDKKYKGRWYRGDRGLKRQYHSEWIIAGCMKRFLDIGKVYTVRGCRLWTPAWSDQYADHRWRRLEYMLGWQDDACVSSPHASLTPFARGISLFARYHVCVCSKRYCNRAAVAASHSHLLLFLVFINILY